MANQRKKLLIAGGGYADIPLILSARQLGYYVITSGNRSDELGHIHSDEYRPADFSDKEAMLKLATEISIDAICPCCNDFSAISSAYVAEELGLPGHDSYETSLLLHHKDQYREFAMANGIPTPVAKGYSDLGTALSSLDNFQLPVIIKPVDLTGGKGITKVHNPDEFHPALENAFTISKSGRIIIEEFLDGTRHGFSAFIREGRVVFHFADNEYYYMNPYLVSGASTPTTAPTSAVEELIYQSEKIAGLMGLVDGIFHVQFILCDRQPVIIEICRRPPGDLYIKLVEHATGVDYPGWIVRAFCGDECHGLTHQEVDGYFLRHCIMASRSGILKNVTFEPEVEDKIVDRMMFWKPGDRVEDYLVTKFGIVFLEFGSPDELLDQSKLMQQLIHADVC